MTGERRADSDVSVGAASAAEDAALAVRVRAGDVAAFEQLFARYYPALLAYGVRQTGARDVADDIVQAVFVDLWQRRASFLPAVNVRVTLFAAARFRILTYRRGETRRSHSYARYLETVVADAAPDTGEGLERREAVQAVAAALAELPERARETFELRYGQGLSVAEAAAVMGVSANTVKTQLARAVGVLRRAAGPFLVVAMMMARA